MRIKYLSLFSGIGGFELGIQQAYENYNRLDLQKQTTEDIRAGESNSKSLSCRRPTCIGYSEIDKYAIQVYKKHFPNHKNYGDINKINANDLPDFDLIVGGFPCQSFSIAGKRRGFKDTRGTLFFEIARIIRKKQPRLLLLENVKGLLSHDKGNTFTTIISTLDELGYDCQWQVLNSKNFGVPQNRERVFIIGHLRGTPRPEVFPFGQDDKENTESKKMGRNTVSATVSTRTGSTAGGQQFINVVGTLDEGTWKKRNESIRRVYGTDGIAPTIPTGGGGGVMPKLLKDTKIRRLTPIECERLQGFPDDWTSEGTEGKISDSQRYKMCGNAVTVNVIQAIMEKLIKCQTTAPTTNGEKT